MQCVHIVQDLINMFMFRFPDHGDIDAAQVELILDAVPELSVRQLLVRILGDHLLELFLEAFAHLALDGRSSLDSNLENCFGLTTERSLSTWGEGIKALIMMSKIMMIMRVIVKSVSKELSLKSVETRGSTTPYHIPHTTYPYHTGIPVSTITFESTSTKFHCMIFTSRTQKIL